MKSNTILKIAFIINLLITGNGWAHPISMSSAAVNIQKDKVLASLKIMLEDLVLYNGLEADENLSYTHADLLKAAKAHQSFLIDGFSIRDMQGKLVNGKITKIDTTEIQQNGVHQSELMARNVYYYLQFPLDAPQQFLTFIQVFGGKNAVLPSVMTFTAFQDQALLRYETTLFHGLPHTLQLDWDNPKPQATVSWRDYQEQLKNEFQDKLGITSYSGLYSFIYITEAEVRHEILIPIVTLEKWLPLPRANKDYIEVSEQQALTASITDFFCGRNPVSIDGVQSTPKVNRLQFFGLDIQDFAMNAEPRRISTYQGRVGIILSYAKAPTAGKAQITWETYNKYAPFMRSVVYALDDQPKVFQFTPQKHKFEWLRPADLPIKKPLEVPKPNSTATISLPLLTSLAIFVAILWVAILFKHPGKGKTAKWIWGPVILVVIAGLSWPMLRVNVKLPFQKHVEIDEDQARAISSALVFNVYQAFDFKDENRIYDALASSVDGKLLEDLYLQIQKGLRMQEQGGARSRVRDMKWVDSRLAVKKATTNPHPQFTIQCRWRVTGTVEHWGHIHSRENEYAAILTLAAISDAWKLTNYELLDERRLKFKTALRTQKYQQ